LGGKVVKEETELELRVTREEGKESKEVTGLRFPSENRLPSATWEVKRFTLQKGGRKCEKNHVWRLPGRH